jgi:hypothetical protein
MPKASHADFVTDWETLLKNVSDAAAELPNMDAYKGPLEQVLTQTMSTIAQSHATRGVKQQGTKDLRGLIVQGKDAAAQLRAAVKAHFGPRSERLLQFGMTPIRPRKKKKEPAPATPPTSAPTSETTPPKPEGTPQKP